MRSRLHGLGVLSAVLLAVLWAAFLYAIIGFAIGFSGGTPSDEDYVKAFLWPGAIGFALAMALGFAAYRYRAAAWLACGLMILCLIFMVWFLV